MTTDVMENRLWIGGESVSGQGDEISVVDPFSRVEIARIAGAGELDVERSIAAADDAFQQKMKRMPRHERADILYAASEALQQAHERFAESITSEAGKPIKQSRAEVSRAIQLFRFAAEGAMELGGVVLPMDAAKGGEGSLGMAYRVPRGVVAAITPFNFPLNLAAHKVAPAIAAGNTIVHKPASTTPLTALALAKLLDGCGLPKGAYNVIVGPGGRIGEQLVRDSRVRFVSFTGSLEVGKTIMASAGIKPVTLELGSNAPNIICDDADWENASEALAGAAFSYAGQSCISPQRIYVQWSVFDTFVPTFVAHAEALKVGDPHDEDTDVGPLIEPSEVSRVHEWVREAVSQGADLLCGGKAQSNVYQPTILGNTSPDMKVVCEEVFGPVVSVEPFDTPEQAVSMANASRMGLQAGVFTKSLDRALFFARELDTGGVWINAPSLLRYDLYPYGGVKDSGIGQEGVKYAIEEMTHLKFVGFRQDVER